MAKRRVKSKEALFQFTLWLWRRNTISSVPKVFHLFSAKANLLFHDVSFPASLNTPFAMAVQERTVMLMAFEVWTYTMITAKSTWRFPFLFSADKRLKWGTLHVSLQTVQWVFLSRWRPLFIKFFFLTVTRSGNLNKVELKVIDTCQSFQNFEWSLDKSDSLSGNHTSTERTLQAASLFFSLYSTFYLFCYFAN